jgi:hypothetical protein
MPGKSIFEKDDDFHVKATALLNTFDWDKLIAIACKHCGDPCNLLSKFSIGNANVMRMLIFEDGVSWMARVRLPGKPSIKLTYMNFHEALVFRERGC